jgi:acetyltransferase-like isoleucine patch superfamily enzyme
VVAEVGVTIGAGVATSDMVAILDTWRVPTSGHRRPELGWPDPAPVVIGAGAYLGMGSIVGPGVHVGDGAYVGENAVVIDDVPAHAVVQGNPARVVRHFDQAAAAWVDRR